MHGDVTFSATAIPILTHFQFPCFSSSLSLFLFISLLNMPWFTVYNPFVTFPNFRLVTHGTLSELQPRSEYSYRFCQFRKINGFAYIMIFLFTKPGCTIERPNRRPAKPLLLQDSSPPSRDRCATPRSIPHRR